MLVGRDTRTYDRCECFHGGYPIHLKVLKLAWEEKPATTTATTLSYTKERSIQHNEDKTKTFLSIAFTVERH